MEQVREVPEMYWKNKMETTKKKLKKKGSRSKGTNPRALGTNPRAMKLKELQGE